ncbi:hypothetical protein KC359_g202 [Hortaea werneckii]|nr:hypothetical protein KC359_g202 [Hortaea werneckii]
MQPDPSHCAPGTQHPPLSLSGQLLYPPPAYSVSWALKVSRKQLPSKEAICLGFVVPMRRYCPNSAERTSRPRFICACCLHVMSCAFADEVKNSVTNAVGGSRICNIPGSVNVVQRQAYQRCTEKMVNCCGTPREAGWLPVVSTNLMSVYDGISSGALASFERKREAG